MQYESALHGTLMVALLATLSVAFPAATTGNSTAATSAPNLSSLQNAQQDSEPDIDRYFVESSEIASNTGPRVITRNVLQERTGTFWLATWHGAMRYDGTTFTNVTNKDGLRRFRVFSLLEDREGNIWLGTTGAGVYRFDGTAYTNYTTADGLVDNTVLSMMQDRDNNIWFGGMGATKFDGTTFTAFDKEDGFTSSDVNSISQAPDGTIWFGSRGALFRYDGESFINFTADLDLNLDSNGYIPTAIDQAGNVWFAGGQGLYYYDGKRVKRIFEPACYSLFVDSRGNIWFSGGALKDQELKPGTSVLNRFNPAAGVENIVAGREQFEIQQGAIFGLSEDKEGNIWFGTGRGIGRIGEDGVKLH